MKRYQRKLGTRKGVSFYRVSHPVQPGFFISSGGVSFKVFGYE